MSSPVVENEPRREAGGGAPPPPRADAPTDPGSELQSPWSPPAAPVPALIALRDYDTCDAERNTLGHGFAFAELAGHACRYSYSEARWYVYDSRRWVRDNGELTEELAARVRAKYGQDAKRRARLASAMPEDTDAARAAREYRRKEAAALEAHVKTALGTARSLSAMVEAARTSTTADGEVRSLAVDPARFDCHPHLLCTPNCVIDLRTGHARPHDPALLMTQMTSALFLPGATAPRWREAVERMMLGDPRRIAFLQRLLGYLITGEARERKVVVFHGSAGNNGKSTVSNVLSGILGPGCVGSLPVATLLEKRFGADEIDVGLASISGKRVVVSVEPNKGARFSTGVVKALSGNDQVGVAARRPHQRDLEGIRPGAKILLLTNHLPTWEDDEAFNERFLIIPFEQTFRGAGERLDFAAELLRREGPGILAWLVEGARQYYADGLDVPEDILVATAERHRDADVIGGWFDACCEKDPTAVSGVGDLYRSYRDHASASGLADPDVESLKTFTKSIRRFDVSRARSRLASGTNPVSVVHGIRLKADGGGQTRPSIREAQRPATRRSPTRATRSRRD